MTIYFPMMLNIENRKCVVVGGGNVAYGKCAELAQCGGKVTLISNHINQRLRIFVEEKVIEYIDGYYDKSHIEGAYLVVASTDDNSVNAQIFQDCNERRILVNVVDDPENCNFIMPAKIRRGDLTIAISTNGKSPTLSKQIKADLESQYDQSYGILLNILGDLRYEIINSIKSHSDRKKIFQEITTKEYLEKTKLQSQEEIKEEIRRLIDEYKTE